MAAPKTLLFAFTALGLVAGCNSGAGNNSTAANGAVMANTTAPSPPVSSPGGGAVDQAFLVGHWAENAACARTVSFNADGTATATGENDPVRWSLEGNILVTTEGDDAPERMPVSRSGDSLVLNGPGGQTLSLTRCAAPAASSSAGAAEATNAAAAAANAQ